MTMDIRQANTHLSAGAGRGVAKMEGTCKLSNKIALITGGTTGIGAATATCFQAKGARVIVTGSDPTTLQVAQEKMPGIEPYSAGCRLALSRFHLEASLMTTLLDRNGRRPATSRVPTL
jgi:hypothetical protein